MSVRLRTEKSGEEGGSCRRPPCRVAGRALAAPRTGGRTRAANSLLRGLRSRSGSLAHMGGCRSYGARGFRPCRLLVLETAPESAPPLAANSPTPGGTNMTDSIELAGLIGPTMVALAVTETINMDVFVNQIAPVVYLNGTILFVAGLAIVRAHNLWTWRWPIIVTLTGWVTLIGGLWRMALPDASQAAESVVTYVILAAVGAIGAILCIKAYGPNVFSAREPTDA